uniref:Uncharacterized protein n=1 Tax=Oryza barthii TaxID=65489 RepID=A0A0D3HT59_9ORYZ
MTRTVSLEAHQREVGSVVGSPAPTRVLVFRLSQGTSFPGFAWNVKRRARRECWRKGRLKGGVWTRAAMERDGWACQEL